VHDEYGIANAHCLYTPENPQPANCLALEDSKNLVTKHFFCARELTAHFPVVAPGPPNFAPFFFSDPAIVADGRLTQ
jgi:hypothetical protein